MCFDNTFFQNDRDVHSTLEVNYCGGDEIKKAYLKKALGNKPRGEINSDFSELSICLSQTNARLIK